MFNLLSLLSAGSAEWNEYLLCRSLNGLGSISLFHNRWYLTFGYLRFPCLFSICCSGTGLAISDSLIQMCWVPYGNECLCIRVEYSSSCCICLSFWKINKIICFYCPPCSEQQNITMHRILFAEKVSLWTAVFCWSHKPISVQISLLLLCQLWPNNKRLLNDRKSSSEFLLPCLPCSQLS